VPLRLWWTRAPDLADLVLPTAEGGRTLVRGLADALAAGSSLVAEELPAGGWRTAIDRLGQAGPGNPDVLLTSVSAEIEDPGPDPADALVQLGRAAADLGVRVLVVNGSSIVSPDPPTDADDDLSLRIRRLNLAAMEASHETGLSVLDADRLLAETPEPGKVRGPFAYSAAACEVVRSTLVAVLDELGVAERSVMEARVPYIRRAEGLSIERWQKAEGERVEPNDVLCVLRLRGLRRMTRPTNAVVLGAIDDRIPLLRRLTSREAVRRRAREATVSVVAADGGVLRRLLRPAGASVSVGEPLALVTADPDTPVDGAIDGPELFRAIVRSDDESVQRLL
jgi:hypothetical protein